MTTLLIDADPMVWKVLTSRKKDGEAPSVEDACIFFDRLCDSYKNQMSTYFDIGGSILYLTPDDRSNFRYNLESEYQYKAQRIMKPKPVGFIEVKNYIREKNNCVEQIGLEADDLIAIEATQSRGKTCVVSVDKDFRQLWDTYIWETNPNKPPEWSSKFGFLIKNMHTTKEPKIYGRGMKWLYYQILAGDSADFIKGANKTGPVKAYKLLDECKTEKEMWDATCEAYKDQGSERAIQNARLLWLRRSHSESLWEPPV